MPSPLPIGKLPADLLARLLGQYTTPDESVVIGPEIGEDAAVIDFGEKYLIAKTDPITFATDAIGWYVINVNANDIAAMGGRPRWFLASILLPEGTATQEMVEQIFSQLSDACSALGIALCGGHTEITYGLDRPIVVGQMLGEVEKEKLVTTAGAQPGDDIILTKGIAVEATSIIAREKEDDLRQRHPPELIERCKAMLYDPGISVLRDAQVAAGAGKVHAMHDPTEGGLATGLYELAAAAGVGLAVCREQIRVLPETALLCREFGLDPLGVIASGALIIALAPNYTPAVLAALEDAGIVASVIGRITPPEVGVTLHLGARAIPMPRFERDEIARLFEDE